MNCSFMRSRALLAMTVVLLGSTAAMAQSTMGPRTTLPPTYGPPTQPLVQGHEATQFSNGFSFQVEATVDEVTRFLPAGYTPAVPTGATNASITAIFSTQNILKLNVFAGEFSPGSYGPFDTFDLVVGARPPGSPVVESVVIARYVNNGAIVDLRNALYGPGTTGYADIDVRTRLSLGQREMTGRVTAEDNGLRIVATQTGLDQIVSSFRNVLLPLPVRITDFTQYPPVPLGSTQASVSSDLTAQLTDPLALEVAALRVRLGAERRMEILQTRPGSFFLNQERHLKSH